MDSITKAKVEISKVYQMAEAAGIGPVSSVTELTGGEFNLAFRLQAGQAAYVVKIGPDPCTRLLAYEYGIMDVEIWVYRMIAAHTGIPVPEIFHFGREVIGNQWFIMAEMPGKLFSDSGLEGARKQTFYRQYGQKIAELHKIHHDRYGYTQLTTHGSWKDAYYDMIYHMIDDAAAQGTVPPACANFMRAIRKNEHALDMAGPPCLVHFDLFDNNVFADADGNFAGVIDAERSFWGDFYADFVAVAPMGGFFENTAFIAGYNEVAEEKIVDRPETRARVSLMRLYLGILIYTETATRLRLEDPAHWQRKHLGAQLIHLALGELEAL